VELNSISLFILPPLIRRNPAPIKRRSRVLFGDSDGSLLALQRKDEQKILKKNQSLEILGGITASTVGSAGRRSLSSDLMSSPTIRMKQRIKTLIKMIQNLMGGRKWNTLVKNVVQVLGNQLN